MLYGWLEVGASNVGVFYSQCNNDIILRTTTSNNKIIVGTQVYSLTAGSNTWAAMYVNSNNVGLKKVPDNDIVLDVNGNVAFNKMLYFHETLSNVSDKLATYTNSNNALYLSYNGNIKIKYTDTDGIRVYDKTYSTEDYYAPAFNVWSDINFKRNITPSSHSTDAAVLSNITTYDYTFWDKPNKPIKGFIAQDVEQWFPQCIVKSVGVIPCSMTPVFIGVQGLISRNALPFGVEIGETIVGTNTVNSLVYDYFVYNVDDSNVHVSGDRRGMGASVNITSKKGFVRSIDTSQLLALCVGSIKDLAHRVGLLESALAGQSNLS